jgi:hypothetical protein
MLFSSYVVKLGELKRVMFMDLTLLRTEHYIPSPEFSILKAINEK